MKLTREMQEALERIGNAATAGADISAACLVLTLALQRGDKVQADLWLSILRERGHDLAPLLKSGK